MGTCHQEVEGGRSPVILFSLFVVHHKQSYPILIQIGDPLPAITPASDFILNTMALSGGATFFLILVIFLILYFLLGYMLKYHYYGLRGVEAIPNLRFWTIVVSLSLKDCGLGVYHACVFVWHGCKGRRTEGAYEEI